MNLQQLLNIVKQKRINAQIDLDKWRKVVNKEKAAELKGERNAYLDIECFIEYCMEREEDQLWQKQFY